jgi:hypothetical protein
MLNALLTEKDVAIVLKLSVKTLQRYRLYGGGPEFIKINKSVRYSPEAIEEFLKPRKVDYANNANQA